VFPVTTPPPTFIHLGLPKTASTSIRFNLFAKHSQVYYLGKFIGGELPAAIRPVILNKWMIKTKNFDADDIHADGVREQLAYAAKNNLTPVLSSESLSGGPLWKKRMQAERFKKFFGECQILLFVREPGSFLKSFYVQMLRNFNQDECGPRPLWMRAIGNPPRYFDINEWMQAAWESMNTPKNFLSCADTANIYANVFGKENVKVFIFEELVRNPESFITKLCSHIGVDPKEGFDLVNGKRSNERLTTDYILRLQEIEQSESLTKQFRKASLNERQLMLGSEDQPGEKINPQISAEWLKKINDVSDKQNRSLVKEWDLPLADYGYRI
jgi:hypothetical protein